MTLLRNGTLVLGGASSSVPRAAAAAHREPSAPTRASSRPNRGSGVVIGRLICDNSGSVCRGSAPSRGDSGRTRRIWGPSCDGSGLSRRIAGPICRNSGRICRESGLVRRISAPSCRISKPRCRVWAPSCPISVHRRHDSDRDRAGAGLGERVCLVRHRSPNAGAAASSAPAYPIEREPPLAAAAYVQRPIRERSGRK
jgi:hypothetical protein